MELLVYSSTGNEYHDYEVQAGGRFRLRCINGHRTSCGNCVGYCRYSGHEGFLTRELRQEHNCLGKQCSYYLPKPRKERKEIAVITTKHRGY